MEIDLSRFGRIIQGVLVLIYAMIKSGVVWSLDKMLVLAFMIIGGTFFYASLFIVFAGVAFFTIQGLAFFNIVTGGSRELVPYPM